MSPLPILPATTPSPRVSINMLILMAYKRAGVLPVEAKLNGANMVPKLEHGRQTLDLIMDALATEGFMARTAGFYELPMVAGQDYYELPDHVLDVYEECMFVPTSGTGELVCKQVDQNTWATLTVKTSISTRPQLYCVFRHGAEVNLRFWPSPFENGTMRLKIVRLFGGAGDGSKAADLERFWYDCLVWQLAWYIAIDSSMPAEKIALLAGIAESKKRQCVNHSFEHTPATQAIVGYTTQWGS